MREALGYAFDFEWSNQTLFYGQYTRTRSYFDNSELAASGLPQGEELALLEPYRGQLPAEVFTDEYQPPVTDGSGNIRDNLRKAVELLKKAGWVVRRQEAGQREDRRADEFEILLVAPAFERITLPFVQEPRAPRHQRARPHRRYGAVHQPRCDDFDFDMAIAGLAAVAVARQRAAQLSGARPPPIQPGSAQLRSASRIRWSTR